MDPVDILACNVHHFLRCKDGVNVVPPQLMVLASRTRLLSWEMIRHVSSPELGHCGGRAEAKPTALWILPPSHLSKHLLRTFSRMFAGEGTVSTDCVPALLR